MEGVGALEEEVHLKVERNSGTIGAGGTEYHLLEVMKTYGMKLEVELDQEMGQSNQSVVGCCC